MENTISKIQCSECGKFFVGETIHARHRQGDYSTWKSRHCMTEQEMREIGMDTEKKNVRIVVEGKTHFEEHDVWFLVASRESVAAYFKPEQGEQLVEADS